MPRKEKPIPKCIQCTNLITLFHALRFDTGDGWCSEACFFKWCDSEDLLLRNLNEKGKKKIQVIGHPTPSAMR
jgi:hypothetical protein